ncbi:MAG: hypothetical protein MHM6MM_003529 [Cercozoa sp. M6MM]
MRLLRVLLVACASARVLALRPSGDCRDRLEAEFERTSHLSPSLQGLALQKFRIEQSFDLCDNSAASVYIDLLVSQRRRQRDMEYRHTLKRLRNDGLFI